MSPQTRHRRRGVRSSLMSMFRSLHMSPIGVVVELQNCWSGEPGDGSVGTHLYSMSIWWRMWRKYIFISPKLDSWYNRSRRLHLTVYYCREMFVGRPCYCCCCVDCWSWHQWHCRLLPHPHRSTVKDCNMTLCRFLVWSGCQSLPPSWIPDNTVSINC